MRGQCSIRLKELTMSQAVSHKQYIRWVKASLNRVLGTDLVDNADDTPEYRFWIKEFQLNQHLVTDGKVDQKTQDALIMRSRYNKDFVIWVQRCLNRSGEASGRLPISGHWDSETTHVLKIFQGNEVAANGAPLLEIDGWVGSKTETALHNRTRIPPPGRYKHPRPPGSKPKPSPPGWSDSLDPALRAQVWLNGMHIDLTANPPPKSDPEQRWQMLCFLSKLRANSGYDFAYLTSAVVHKFVMANQLRHGSDADDIAHDAKTEVLNYTRYAQRKNTYSEGRAVFEAYVWSIFYAITRGQNKVAEFVADKVGNADDPGVKHLEWWVKNRQAKSSSILSCFT
jgi:hypothetical protein